MEFKQSLLQKPKVILFDVYETLLNMQDLARKINTLLGSRHGYTLWLQQLMQYCLFENSIGRFTDFFSVSVSSLNTVARSFNKTLRAHDVENTLSLLEYLPLHEGVQNSLSILADGGYRIAALTNSSQDIVKNRMSRTGLVSYFNNILSAEQVRLYKPALDVYRWAADILNTPPSQILFVSSHQWDIAGAKEAGMQTALIMRSDEYIDPFFAQADVSFVDLITLVNKLSF